MAFPSKDKYFMDIAVAVSKRANCVGRKVGAVITLDERIISTGYNGTPSNVPNCLDGGCYRCKNREKFGTALNPYSFGGTILKAEDVNYVDGDPRKPFRDLYGYAISAKRMTAVRSYRSVLNAYVNNAEAKFDGPTESNVAVGLVECSRERTLWLANIAIAARNSSGNYSRVQWITRSSSGVRSTKMGALPQAPRRSAN